MWPFMQASAASSATKDLGPFPYAQKNFALPFFQKFHLPFFKFRLTLKKGAIMAKTEITAVQSENSTGSRPRRIPRVLAFDPQGDFRHFEVIEGHVTNFGKPIIVNFENSIPCQKRK